MRRRSKIKKKKSERQRKTARGNLRQVGEGMG